MKLDFHNRKRVCDNEHDKSCNSQRQNTPAMGLHVPFQLTTAPAAARDLARSQRWPDVNRIAMFTSH